MKILNSQLQFKFEIPISPLHFEYLSPKIQFSYLMFRC